MTAQDVAIRLVKLCREGKNPDAIKELYGENVVSIEPKGAQAERTEGKENFLPKLWAGFPMSSNFTALNYPTQS